MSTAAVAAAAFAVGAGVAYMYTTQQQQSSQSATPLPPPVELVYFGARGRAEAIRLMLEDLGYAYTDTRLTRDEWLAVKHSGRFEFEQLPALSHGDDATLRAPRIAGAKPPKAKFANRTAVQTNAILRLLARRHGLDGATAYERHRVDVLLGAADDVRTAYSRLVYNPAFDDAAARAFIDTTLPAWLVRLSRALSANGGFFGGASVFVGDAVTVADYALYDALDVATRFVRLYDNNATPLLDHAALRAFMTSFAARPRIAAYLASDRRPPHANGATAQFDNGKNPPPQ